VSLAAGRLDRRVTLLRPVEVQNALSGEVTLTYEEAGGRFAQRLAYQPRAQSNDAQLLTEAQTSIVMRLDRLTRTIGPCWRVRMDARTFEVLDADSDPRAGTVRVLLIGLST
jgi:head-tail adaptor